MSSVTTMTSVDKLHTKTKEAKRSHLVHTESSDQLLLSSVLQTLNARPEAPSLGLYCEVSAEQRVDGFVRGLMSWSLSPHREHWSPWEHHSSVHIRLFVINTHTHTHRVNFRALPCHKALFIKDNLRFLQPMSFTETFLSLLLWFPNEPNVVFNLILITAVLKKCGGVGCYRPLKKSIELA